MQYYKQSLSEWKHWDIEECLIIANKIYNGHKVCVKIIKPSKN